ncbi:unnamed protein product [Clonostachys solani]|uniref:Uncharacterized protein n=1 Tax=Clonostachys solani TaxID=160281 RepID=A0A9N9W9E3_9HYPO|nr:unnamed protein product [Clonostachys solani]
MNAGTFRDFDVLFSTKHCPAADWHKFWTDFTSAFEWVGTGIIWPASEDTSPEKVQMSCRADTGNCQRAGHLLVHHGFKKRRSSAGDTLFESPENIPAIDMSAQQTWIELTTLSDAISRL